MKFTVELQINELIFKHIFYAENLNELSEEIIDIYPKAKVLSVIGGGV